MNVSIRLTKDERKLADSYAKNHSVSLTEAFKLSLFEKLKMSMILISQKKRIMIISRMVRAADRLKIFGKNLCFDFTY